MNNFGLYSIYDKVACTYGAPSCQLNHGCAIRWFNAVVSRNEFAEPTDFELYQLGSFDNSLGDVVSFHKPEFICKGQVIDNA